MTVSIDSIDCNGNLWEYASNVTISSRERVSGVDINDPLSRLFVSLFRSLSLAVMGLSILLQTKSWISTQNAVSVLGDHANSRPRRR